MPENEKENQPGAAPVEEDNTNKEETTGLEICGQLSCDNCQLTKCPQGAIAF